MKFEKVSIFLVLSLQTNVLANDKVSVLPLLIYTLLRTWNKQHKSSKSYLSLLSYTYRNPAEQTPEQLVPGQASILHPSGLQKFWSQPRFRLRHRGLLMFAWRERINWVERVQASAKSGFHFSLYDKKRQTHTNLWRGQVQKSRFWVTSDTIETQKASSVYLTYMFW